MNYTTTLLTFYCCWLYISFVDKLNNIVTLTNWLAPLKVHFKCCMLIIKYASSQHHLTFYFLQVKIRKNLHICTPWYQAVVARGKNQFHFFMQSQGLRKSTGDWEFNAFETTFFWHSPIFSFLSPSGVRIEGGWKYANNRKFTV